jgi:phosphonatase-like hydrolase
MKPALVVFDMAGTTVKEDHAVHHCLIEACKEFGLEINIADANKVMGIPKPEAIKILLVEKQHPLDIPLEEAISDIYQTFERIMIAFYKNDPHLKAAHYADELFSALKAAGIKIALDTGFARPVADIIIERLRWNNRIDFSICSDEVAHGRPHPDMIQACMKALNVDDIKQVAKVGDTKADLEEGTNAGCTWVIGVCNGAYSKEELLPHAHTHLVNDLSELIPLFIG